MGANQSNDDRAQDVLNFHPERFVFDPAKNNNKGNIAETKGAVGGSTTNKSLEFTWPNDAEGGHDSEEFSFRRGTSSQLPFDTQVSQLTSIDQKSSDEGSHFNEESYSDERPYSDEGLHYDEGPRFDQGPYSEEGPCSNEAPYSYEGPHSDEGTYSAEGLHFSEEPCFNQGPYSEEGPCSDKAPYSYEELHSYEERYSSEGLHFDEGPQLDEGQHSDEEPCSDEGPRMRRHKNQNPSSSIRLQNKQDENQRASNEGDQEQNSEAESDDDKLPNEERPQNKSTRHRRRRKRSNGTSNQGKQEQANQANQNQGGLNLDEIRSPLQRIEMEKRLTTELRYWLLTEGGQFLLSSVEHTLKKLNIHVSNPQDFIHRHTDKFRLCGSDAAEKHKKWVIATTDLKICHRHVSKSGCNSGKTCEDLHVCKFYLLTGTCKAMKQGRRCRYGHNVKDPHNKSLLEHHSLENLPLKCLNVLFQRNRSSALYPKTCKFFNNANGCSKDRTCLGLHVCKHYILGDCKFGQRCKFGHDLYDAQPRSILQLFGFDVNLSQQEIISELKNGMPVGNDDDDDDTSVDDWSSVASGGRSSTSGISLDERSGRSMARGNFTERGRYMNGGGCGPRGLGGERRGSRGFMGPREERFMGERGNRRGDWTSNRGGPRGGPRGSFMPMEPRGETFARCGPGQNPRGGMPMGPRSRYPGDMPMGPRGETFARGAMPMGPRGETFARCGPGQNVRGGMPMGPRSWYPGDMPMGPRGETFARGAMPMGPRSRYPGDMPMGPRGETFARGAMPMGPRGETLARYGPGQNVRGGMPMGPRSRYPGDMPMGPRGETFGRCGPGQNPRSGAMPMGPRGGTFSRNEERRDPRGGGPREDGLRGTRGERRGHRGERRGQREERGRSSGRRGGEGGARGQSGEHRGSRYNNQDGRSSRDERDVQDSDLPVFWDKRSDGNRFQLVPITKDGSTFHEYEKIETLFFETMSRDKYRIEQIQRIENPDLYKGFQFYKKRMEKHSSSNAVEEKFLFHGTQKEYVDAICLQGFDFRLSGSSTASMYGRGSYFAKRAEYSRRYTKSQQLFVARVLVGRCAKGESRYTRPPPIDPDEPLGDVFDSCVDDVKNPQIFVIFAIEQAYPEYLIDFEKV